MARPLSKSVLLTMVNEAREDDDGSRILAVQGAPRWEGEQVLETDEGPVRIAPCVSPLAVRDVLAHRSDAENGEVLVLLTDRSEDELGQEVLSQVWRRRLLRPSKWDAAKRLFRVDRLDPALADARWLVDLLVDVAPPRGYPPPASGLLEFGTAWRTFLRHGLRLDVEEPTLEDLLRWGESDAAVGALGGFSDRHGKELAERLQEDVGPAARHIVRIAATGRGRDLVPLGLVADVLWGHSGTDDPGVLTARVRFEEPVGSKDIPGVVARPWGDAAVNLVRRAEARGQDQTVARWLSRAEPLLTDLEALDLAVVSDVLPWAFTERMIHAGRALGRALDEPGDEALESLHDSLAQVEGHIRANHDDTSDRVERLQMAVRLVRRMRGERAEPERELGALVETFVADGAWVDLAREAIGHGETVSSLADAYASLIEELDSERADRDRRFAEAFASWSDVLPTESAPLLPIERVLEEVVAPVARQVPVLMLVLDGLSYPESIRLFAQIRNAGWNEQGPEGRPLPRVLAAVPTVTSVSRSCLLSGRLVSGGQDVERSGFESHTELLEASEERPPRLFHKKDLKTEQARFAPDVRDAILDPSVRIVASVVNAVDDHLEKGSQIRLAEGLRALRPLRPLLEAAAEAGRAVVIASDHGHVLENGSEARVTSGAAERWRSSDGAPSEDEVVISGPRVLRGDGEVIVPAVESIRYMAAEKRGYHGGATPQEVLCPLTVFTTGGVTLDGWDSVLFRKPEWWQLDEGVAPASRPRVRQPEPIVEPDGQAALFTEEGRAPTPAVEAAGWIDELLASPIFEEQREAAGRQALDDDSIEIFLSVLDQAGGVAPPAVFADVTDLPPSRIRTKLEAMRRMLNLDGYAVLTIESDGTARLNRELLATQFELEL